MDPKTLIIITISFFIFSQNELVDVVASGIHFISFIHSHAKLYKIIYLIKVSGSHRGDSFNFYYQISN